MVFRRAQTKSTKGENEQEFDSLGHLNSVKCFGVHILKDMTKLTTDYKIIKTDMDRWSSFHCHLSAKKTAETVA